MSYMYTAEIYSLEDKMSFNVDDPVPNHFKCSPNKLVHEILFTTLAVLKRIGQYCSKPDFKPEIVGRVSLAAKSLCMWVRAMEVYGRIYRVVEPKKKRLEAANRQLAEKQASLREAKEKLREVKDKLDQLQKEYEEKLATKEDLRKKAELTELRLDRAAKLVTGLAGERVRWEESVKVGI